MRRPPNLLEVRSKQRPTRVVAVQERRFVSSISFLPRVLPGMLGAKCALFRVRRVLDFSVYFFYYSPLSRRPCGFPDGKLHLHMCQLFGIEWLCESYFPKKDPGGKQDKYRTSRVSEIMRMSCVAV